MYPNKPQYKTYHKVVDRIDYTNIPNINNKPDISIINYIKSICGEIDKLKQRLNEYDKRNITKE